MKTKTIRGAMLKALDDAGHGVARIAILSAIDSDGDTYSAGAFGEQWSMIQPAHDWGSVPLGKARVHEDGDEALAELHFNLDIEAGRDWHAALKFDLDGCCDGAKSIQEWSYGFSILDSAQETREGERVRVLKRLDVVEVSPVLRGAGIGTATLALKHGQPFADQVDATAEAVRAVTARATRIALLRSDEAGGLLPEQLEQLGGLKQALDGFRETGADLDALLIDPKQLAEAGQLLADFHAIRSRKWVGRKGRRLGALLRELRDDSELGNEDLADAAGIDVSTMGAILSGDINCPPLNRLSDLAERLGVPVSRLRGAAEDDGCEYGA